MAEEVIVLGAGLAGLTAGLVLADRGLRVRLIEAGPRVGGKLQAWWDQDGDLHEHGCHIWWDQYHNCYHLFQKFGLAGELHPLAPEFALLKPGGEATVISSAWLNSPYGLAGLLLRLPRLNLVEKIGTLVGSLRMLRYQQRAHLDDISFLCWARHSGFGQAVIDQFFSTVIPSHFYLPLDAVSAAVVLAGRPNYFSHRTRQVSVLHRDSQTALLEPMVRMIRERGGEVHLLTRAEHLVLDGKGIRSVWIKHSDGRTEQLTARYFISALDVPNFQRLVGPLLPRAPQLAGVMRLTCAPVMVARVWLTKPLAGLHTRVGHFTGSALLHTFFHVGALQPAAVRTGDGDLLEVQMGPVEDFIHLPEDELRTSILTELARFLPDFTPGKVRKLTVLRYPQGFTSFRVGSERYRPEYQSPWPNLWFAGDWVRVPTPVFGMERAVLTAVLASNAILAATGRRAWPIHQEAAARWTGGAGRSGKAG